MASFVMGLPRGIVVSLIRPILLPFVKEFVPVVDLQRGRMLVTPPEGLLELSEAKYLPQSDEEQNIDDD